METDPAQIEEANTIMKDDLEIQENFYDRVILDFKNGDVEWLRDRLSLTEDQATYLYEQFEVRNEKVAFKLIELCFIMNLPAVKAQRLVKLCQECEPHSDMFMKRHEYVDDKYMDAQFKEYKQK